MALSASQETMKEANKAGERKNESEGVDAETDLPEGENEGQGDDEEQKEEVSQGQFQRSHADQVLHHEVCDEKKVFTFANCKLV